MAVVMAGRRPAAGAATGAAPATGRDLWGAEELLRWGLAVGVGGLVVAVSWYVCAGDASFSKQIGPTDAAIGGLVLAGLGNAMWLLRGRRTLGERRRALLPDVVVVAEPVGRVTRVSGVSEARPDELLVAGVGMELFHRPDCALAAGRGWTTMTRAEHEAAGRHPCGVCRA
jgi:hypothetical protein